jgi:hypothetical protein
MQHDCANLFQLKMNATSSCFSGSNVDVVESSGIVKDEAFVLTFQGLKVEDHVCGDVEWRIKRCPPLANTHCSVIQRNSMKHCDAQIIIICGIPSPCYNGL